MVNIPGYTPLEELHVSPCSRVWRIRNQQNQKTAIAKWPSSDKPSHQEIANFKHEYFMLQQLSMHGVLKAHKIIETELTPVLILEDYEGVPLSQYLHHRALAINKFFIIAIQLAEVLAGLHKLSIMHKDIKPANIIINPKTLSITLVDFSNAANFSDAMESDVNLEKFSGTVAYMSPEQTGRMNRVIDYRTDMYSLGITLYEMLIGEPPFVSNDATELTYKHIVEQPKSLTILRPDIPLMVAKIVSKLLAKIPEERYNHATVLKHDLQVCAQYWEEQQNIPEFPLAKGDVQDKLIISPKLYGRKAQINALINVFEENILERNAIALISGFAGIGKTSLVNEILKPITKQHAYFISGKYEVMGRSKPLSAIIQAVDHLINQSLTLPDDKLKALKKELLAALKSNGQVLIDVVPSLEIIIGKQPPVPSLNPIDLQNRFILMFQHFMQVFAKPSHPLVIFLDDLQWADVPSLNFIENILTDHELKHILIIGAYRDNEIDVYHPLLTTIQHLKQAKIPLTSISLQPLDIHCTTQLLVDSLNLPNEDVTQLAELIQLKTQGNPFFINLFLQTIHQNKLLNFNYEDLKWEWNIHDIEQQNITDNVVELLLSQMQMLPDDLRLCLFFAACIGYNFDFRTLAKVTAQSYTQTAKQLKNISKLNFVTPVGNASKLVALAEDAQEIPPDLLTEKINYCFTHDRILQAASQLFNEQLRCEAHLKIAHLMLKEAPLTPHDERLFAIVDYLYMGLALITTAEEKRELAKYFLWAGQKAKASAAYQVASSYFAKGIALLEEKSWQVDYQNTFALHSNHLDCLYLLRQLEQDEYFAHLLTKAATKEEKAELYLIKIRTYASIDQHSVVVKIGAEALKMLGFHTTTHVSLPKLLKEILLIRYFLRGRKLDSIDQWLKPNSDPRIALIIKILNSTIPSSYLCDANLCAYNCCLVIRLSLRHGYCVETSTAFVSYSVILIGELNNIPLGEKFCKASKKLEEHITTLETSAKNRFMEAFGVINWISKLSNNMNYLYESFKSNLENGNLEYAAYSRLHDYILFRIGRYLPSLQKSFEESLQFFKWVKNEGWYRHFLFHTYIMDYLCGQNISSAKFNKLLEEIKNDTLALQAGTYAAYCELLYLQGDYQGALIYGESFMKIRSYITGFIEDAYGIFFCGLSLAKCYKYARGFTKLRYWIKLKHILHKTGYWAKHCPDNYAFMHWLLKAEFDQYSKRNVQQILSLYDHAITAAKENGYINYMAVINECAGQYLVKNKLFNAAASFIQSACYAYQRWGAAYKCKKLAKQYPEWITVVQDSTGDVKYVSSFSHTISSVTFDYLTILKASQAISKEINLDKLLSTLLQLVMEYAGAHKAVFFLEKNDDLIAVAEANHGEPSEVYTEGKQLATMELPQSILYFVKRTHQDVTLNDTFQFDKFSQDPYLQKYAPKSLICMPILQKTRAIGYIYLENRLSQGMFTLEHLKFLELLLGQMAISLENAEFYEASTRFVPMEFLNQINRYTLVDVSLGDQKECVMSILFCDIRDFTSLAEKQTTIQIFEFINQFLGAMSPIIKKNHGFIDKFIGDAIMALFEHPEDAVLAAIDMIDELKSFNKLIQEKGYPTIKVGIGINTGHLMLGIIGGQNRLEASVIGDAVNVAARIEQLTRQYQENILISDATKALLPGNEFNLEKVGEVDVKGKSKPITVWRIA